MPLSKQVLKFGLTHSDNRYHAAILADELGSAMCAVTPAVSFPSDWVLEKSRGSVDIAIFAVTNCDDPAILSEISRKDRRHTVLKALCANRAFPETAYQALIARSTYAHQQELTAAYNDARVVPLTLEEKIEEFLNDPATLYNNESEYHRKDHMVVVQKFAAHDHTVVDRLIRKEAERSDSCALALTYLQHYYARAAKYAKTWDLLTLTPSELIGLYSKAPRTKLLEKLLQCVVSTSPLHALIDEDIAPLLAELAAPSNVSLFNSQRHDIFTAEATDLLVQHPRWAGVLSVQEISDEQFLTILSAASADDMTTLTILLGTSRVRLAAYLEKLTSCEPARLLRDSDWSTFTLCHGPQDPPQELLSLVPYSSQESIISFLKGELVYPETETRVLPEIDDLPLVLNYLTISTSTARLFVNAFNAGYLPGDYIDSLVDLTPGLAYVALDNTIASRHVYEVLMATGATLDEAIAALDAAKEQPLLDIAAALRDEINAR